LADHPDAPLPNANIRAAGYCIAHTRAACPHCGCATLLSALVLEAGHETREDDSDDWQPVGANAFIFNVAAVSAAVYTRLRKDAPNLRFVFHEPSGISYWANHCRHCGLSIGDDEVHGEPGIHGFVLCSEAHAAGVDLIEVCEPFEASAGGYALEPEFFAFVRRVR
jgi:hypothetical protein